MADGARPSLERGGLSSTLIEEAKCGSGKAGRALNRLSPLCFGGA